MSIESVMPSNHLILCCPLLLLASIFPSIRVFSNELALHIRWPKYLHFSFNTSPTNEHPGLISFRMDWLAGTSPLLNQSQKKGPCTCGMPGRCQWVSLPLLPAGPLGESLGSCLPVRWLLAPLLPPSRDLACISIAFARPSAP